LVFSTLRLDSRDRKLFGIEKCKLLLHADLISLVGTEINDMIVDDQRWAYLGSYGFKIPASARCHNGHLVLVDPTGTAGVSRPALSFRSLCHCE